MYIEIIYDCVTGTVAKRLGVFVQCTVESRGKAEWMHEGELEERHTHSMNTRIMYQMQTAGNRQ